ncbi:short chain dehydrogenase [Streptomyces lincolnensis]|uniref:Short chain dehydrogenase n=1 Tax=Streptomyces lincolnensis TaxID=1915 RepID=A0A1B1M1B7_STRLN|nr:short chain dehydrogenase [Streptomyces lincolnensis]ANS70806.1 short chain dehydrogenase [Streptomyces lincolnensis]AXG51164.1 short chain dehydrogenase [Streptomyces lincolnensis]
MNINGFVNTVSAAMEQIIANQGQVVLISSVFAFLNGVGAIPYAMSKSAVEQLGRGLRVELARHGASATTACFSLIQTDMIRNGRCSSAWNWTRPPKPSCRPSNTVDPV